MSRRFALTVCLSLTTGLLPAMTPGQEPTRRQDPSPRTEPAARSLVDGLPQRDTTLYLLASDESGKTIEQIKNAFHGAKKAVNKNVLRGQPPVCEFDDPMVRAIPALIYDEFAKMEGQIQQAPRVTEGKGDVSGRAKVFIRPIPSRDSAWEVDLNAGRAVQGKPLAKDDFLFMREMIVKFKSGPPETLKPVAIGEAAVDAPLVMVIQGNYVVRLKPDRQPSTFMIHATNLKGKPIDLPEETWPEDSLRYYIITLKNFRGDRKQLFEAMKEGPTAQIASPFQDIRLDHEYMLTFASLSGELPVVVTEFEGNKYIPTVPTLAKRNVRRVWILFPLDEAGLKAAKAKYEGMNSIDLVADVRAAGTRMATALPGRTNSSGDPIYDEVKVTSEMVPTWIELGRTANGSRFSRDLMLEDIRKLQQRFPRVWRLKVWEFDNDVTREAIEVQHPDRPKERVYVVDEEIKQWPEALERAGGTETSPPPTVSELGKTSPAPKATGNPR